jgi:hypothetical protein
VGWWWQWNGLISKVPCCLAEGMQRKGTGWPGNQRHRNSNICLLLKLVHKLHFVRWSACAQ